MHGRFQREGEGSCRSPRHSTDWHMHPTVIAADSNSFSKDGRNISVGDCALFKPPQDSPPFIGLIRRLTLNKDNSLQVGVNWLYRPAELKLGKGYLLDSAPNEIFYSFHKDEIPAASLLHPCKVAFLPRGAELPTGTSSFVCRRVYDIESKCLWWLTDQDYINERQEEVDQLLYNTRIEMHGTSQTGGRSPKQVNGLTSASQLKPGSENAQNSGSSFPSQTRGKKRERGDHSTDPVKKERSSRTEDNGSGQHKTENNVKSDIAKIAEKGGVIDFEGVEKLLRLMQPDRSEKKMDLISRSVLTSVVAATEKVECLNRFMQLKGLSVFDEWLQDIHKGKVGGGNNSKDGDKLVEDFLLVLLRALDKLPVNLPALQTCNIGRSVNHLRSHKNADIQRKARSLVDIWKKRVQAEMTSIDAETGSAQGAPVWSSKSRLPEASHDGNRTPSGSDVALKSTVTQHSASKNTSVKSSHGENNIKSASSSPGPVKPSSPPASIKESQPGTSVNGSGTSDAPLVREDRSSSSNQSHSYSQAISTKEDAKSSTAASPAASKISHSSSRTRKGGSFPGVSGAQKESSSIKSLATRSSTSDKASPSGFASEKALEGSVLEADNPKIIVRISNRSRSPTQGVRVVSPDDHSAVSSETSPPVLSDKPYRCDNKSREKSETPRCNASPGLNVDSSQGNDRKDILTESGDGAGSVAVPIDEDKRLSPEDATQSTEGTLKNQLKGGKLHETSFSPMNALIESCVKYSEANSSFSPEDDAGMNLLASVATGEMSRSELISPTDSMERNTPAKEEVGFTDDVKSECSPEDQIQGTDIQRFCNDGGGGYKKQALLNGSWPEDGLLVPKQESISANINCRPPHSSADMPTEVRNEPCDCSDTINNADPHWEASKKPTHMTDADAKLGDGDISKEVLEEKVPSSNACVNDIVYSKNDGTNAAGNGDNSCDHPDTVKETARIDVASANQSCAIDCKSDVNNELMVGTNSMKNITAIIVKSDHKDTESDEKREQTAPQQIFSEAGDAVRVGERDVKDIKNLLERDGVNGTVDRNMVLEGHRVAGSCYTIDGLKSNNKDGIVEKEETEDLISHSVTGFPASVVHGVHKNDNVRGSKDAGIKEDEVKSASSVAEVSSATAGSNPDAKVRFDLNEGFSVDDGKYGEPVSFVVSASTNVQMSNSQVPANPCPTLHPASITVAAAAKGPFVPPEDLLRSKGELGWKGSAATSAFRPAEPRKVIEMPLASKNLSCDASSTRKSNHGRVMLDIDLNIDLNVPDEKVLEVLSSRECNLVNDAAILLNKSSGSIPALGSGGLDLDLNRIDESNEIGQCSTSRSHNEEGFILQAKSSGGLPSADIQRGFDLNDRPGFEDGSAEHLTIIQQAKVAMPSQLPVTGSRTNNPGLGSLSSWFPPANTYSTVAIPSVIPDRADHAFPAIPPGIAQRTFGPPVISPFMSDVYRGSVLSSSPAGSFPPSALQFPVFPYGPSFPLQSSSFPVGGNSYADSSSGTRLFAPPVNSQLLGVGPVGGIPSSYQRPFMVGLPDNGRNSALESSRKLATQGLDLNAGPGAVEGDAREHNLLHSSSQHSVANSQLQVEEQARLYPVSGNILKRVEPDGGWDTESFRYKQQSSWQ